MTAVSIVLTALSLVAFLLDSWLFGRLLRRVVKSLELAGEANANAIVDYLRLGWYGQWRIYGALDALWNDGIVEIRFTEPTPERGNRRGVMYRLRQGGCVVSEPSLRALLDTWAFQRKQLAEAFASACSAMRAELEPVGGRASTSPKDGGACTLFILDGDTWAVGGCVAAEAEHTDVGDRCHAIVSVYTIAAGECEKSRQAVRRRLMDLADSRGEPEEVAFAIFKQLHNCEHDDREPLTHAGYVAFQWCCECGAIRQTDPVVGEWKQPGVKQP